MWRRAPKGKWAIWGEEFCEWGFGHWVLVLMSLARITFLLIPERHWVQKPCGLHSGVVRLWVCLR